MDPLSSTSKPRPKTSPGCQSSANHSSFEYLMIQLQQSQRYRLSQKRLHGTQAGVTVGPRPSSSALPPNIHIRCCPSMTEVWYIRAKGLAFTSCHVLAWKMFLMKMQQGNKNNMCHGKKGSIWSSIFRTCSDSYQEKTAWVRIDMPTRHINWEKWTNQEVTKQITRLTSTKNPSPFRTAILRKHGLDIKIVQIILIAIGTASRPHAVTVQHSECLDFSSNLEYEKSVYIHI